MIFSSPRGGRQPSRASARARHDLGRGLGLHVERAAAPHVAVVQLARPRVARPVLRRGEHGVDVGEVAEHRAVGLAAQPRDQVRALVLDAVELALEARLGQVVAQVLLAFPLLPRRVDGVEADQVAEDVGGLLLQVHRRQLTRRAPPQRLRRASGAARGRPGSTDSRITTTPTTLTIGSWFGPRQVGEDPDRQRLLARPR